MNFLWIKALKETPCIIRYFHSFCAFKMQGIVLSAHNIIASMCKYIDFENSTVCYLVFIYFNVCSYSFYSKTKHNTHTFQTQFYSRIVILCIMFPTSCLFVNANKTEREKKIVFILCTDLYWQPKQCNRMWTFFHTLRFRLSIPKAYHDMKTFTKTFQWIGKTSNAAMWIW